MRRFPFAPLTLALLALSLLLGACGGPGPEDRAHHAEPPTTSEPAAAPPTTPTTTPATEQDEPTAVIARATTALTVRSAPDQEAAVVAELPATTEFGSPRALLVTGRQPGWVRVQLPVRPNGSAGWVPDGAVELVAGDHGVTVDLEARRLTVFEGDAVVLETTVAVGAPDAPTPTGTFAVIDRLQSPDPASPYGPFALGLSAHSDTFSEFAGGDGQIGIHGTDDPTSIGQAVSHGCIRVPNDIVARLAELLPLGTPVTIV
jgi:lipoprotein-anchoring transpeptidase ErfK/SrfK